MYDFEGISGTVVEMILTPSTNLPFSVKNIEVEACGKPLGKFKMKLHQSTACERNVLCI